MTTQTTRYVDALEQPLPLLALFLGIVAPVALLARLADRVWEQHRLGFDAPLLWFIHRYATHRRDQIAILISHLGGAAGMLGLATVLALLLFYLHHRRDAVFLCCCAYGAGALSLLAKTVFARPRPDLWRSPAPEFDHSFPSSHSMLSMAVMAALITLAWPSRWRWPVLIAGVLCVLAIGSSRLYLGVHYPSDVLAGWCASLVWVTGLHALLRRPRTVEEDDASAAPLP